MADICYVRQSHEILTDNGPWDVDLIAEIARTCYKSEPKGDTEEERFASNMRLVRALISRAHGAMLEHSFMSVRFTMSRAISAEMTRHRLFSFAHESTRYVNYDNRGFRFILPETKNPFVLEEYRTACETSAKCYESLLENGCKPEIARGVLPLCLAADVVVSGNFREWRHAFGLRTAKDAHPEIRALMTDLLKDARQTIPIIFDDIEPYEG